MSASVLSLRDVSKVYSRPGGDHLKALQGVTIEVAEARKVAVIGRSGSGKSTLLHLAAGIDRPTSGRVSVLGHDLTALSERECTRLRRESVGLVFQFFHLLPHLSVRENVLLPAWIAGERGGAFEERAQDLLRNVGLDSRAGDPVQRLSGGEMQRVAICRALLRRPRLLLADEPTGSLDDENGRRVMDLLFRMAEEERATLLFVTHSQDLAAMADETWRIHSGILERV